MLLRRRYAAQEVRAAIARYGGEAYRRATPFCVHDFRYTYAMSGYDITFQLETSVAGDH